MKLVGTTMNKIIKIILIALAAFGISVIAINIYIVTQAAPYIHHASDAIPERYAVLVLGAKVYKDRLSDILQDRVDAGVSLLKRAKAQKLLLSGDHRQKRYDETNHMKQYVLSNYPDIQHDDIFLDHAGFDTYDSVARAKLIFQADSMIIVTQIFHCYRAVYLARSIGIDAVGLAVSENKYSILARLYWSLREVLARVKAFGDIILKSKPALLGEQIPIQGDGRTSWD